MTYHRSSGRGRRAIYVPLFPLHTDLGSAVGVAYVYIGDSRAIFDKSLFDNVESIQFQCYLNGDGTADAKLYNETDAVDIDGSEITGGAGVEVTGDIKGAIPNKRIAIRILARDDTGSYYIGGCVLVVQLRS